MAERSFTRWSPDTCGCVIEYYNDDQSYKATVSACAKHANNQGNPAHLVAIFAHNRKKNGVYNLIRGNMDTVAELLPLITQFDPNAPAGNDPIHIHGVGALAAQGIKIGGQPISITRVTNFLLANGYTSADFVVDD